MSIEENLLESVRSLKAMGQKCIDLATKVADEFIEKEKTKTPMAESVPFAELEDLEKFNFHGISYRRKFANDRILMSEGDPEVCFGAIMVDPSDGQSDIGVARLFKAATIVQRISKK